MLISLAFDPGQVREREMRVRMSLPCYHLKLEFECLTTSEVNEKGKKKLNAGKFTVRRDN